MLKSPIIRRCMLRKELLDVGDPLVKIQLILRRHRDQSGAGRCRACEYVTGQHAAREHRKRFQSLRTRESHNGLEKAPEVLAKEKLKLLRTALIVWRCDPG